MSHIKNNKMIRNKICAHIQSTFVTIIHVVVYTFDQSGGFLGF